MKLLAVSTAVLALKLVIRTFSFTEPYDLCVDPPGGHARECNTYPLKAVKHGIFASRIDFARNYFHAADGRYTVTWHAFGNRLGKALHFSRG